MFRKGAANQTAREDIGKRISQGRGLMGVDELIQYAVEEKKHNPEVAGVWDMIGKSKAFDDAKWGLYRAKPWLYKSKESQLQLYKSALERDLALMSKLQKSVYDSLMSEKIPEESELGSMEEFVSTPEEREQGAERLRAVPKSRHRRRPPADWSPGTI